MQFVIFRKIFQLLLDVTLALLASYGNLSPPPGADSAAGGGPSGYPTPSPMKATSSTALASECPDAERGIQQEEDEEIFADDRGGADDTLDQPQEDRLGSVSKQRPVKSVYKSTHTNRCHLFSLRSLCTKFLSCLLPHVPIPHAHNVHKLRTISERFTLQGGMSNA